MQAVFIILIALTLAKSDLTSQEIVLYECGDTRTCLGSTAIDNDPLTTDNSCLADNVSAFKIYYLCKLMTCF